MFSPSLQTLLLLSASQDRFAADTARDNLFASWVQLASWLQTSPPSNRPRKWPVVGTSSAVTSPWFDQSYGLEFAPQLLGRGSSENNGFGIWGWIDAQSLTTMYANRAEYGADLEYIDLGAPVSAFAPASAAAKASLRSLLNAAPVSAQANSVVAIVDLGVRAAASNPDNFGGRIEHANTTSIDWSEHAVNVMQVLCEKLRLLHKLQDVRLICSLVEEPPPQCVTLTALQQTSNVADIEAAVDKLDQLLQQPRYQHLRAFVNLSLGTHLGPHDGSSPFESKITSLTRGAASGSTRFVHVAAGNEGTDGMSQEVTTRPNEPSVIRFRLSSDGADEFLIELWWEDDGMAFDISVEWKAGSLGAPIMLNLNRTTQGGVVQVRLSGDYVATWSTGPNNQIGLAVAGSCRGAAVDLAGLITEIQLTTITARRVFCWRVFPTTADSAFFEGLGDRGPTLAVPATADNLICVGGHMGTHLPWVKASSGPLANYGAPVHVPARDLRPQISHDVTGPSGIDGTSFACPRTCAESVLRLPATAAALSDLIDALRLAATAPAVSTVSGTAYPYHAQLGFGAL